MTPTNFVFPTPPTEEHLCTLKNLCAFAPNADHIECSGTTATIFDRTGVAEVPFEYPACFLSDRSGPFPKKPWTSSDVGMRLVTHGSLVVPRNQLLSLLRTAPELVVMRRHRDYLFVKEDVDEKLWVPRQSVMPLAEESSVSETTLHKVNTKLFRSAVRAVAGKTVTLYLGGELEPVGVVGQGLAVFAPTKHMLAAPMSGRIVKPVVEQSLLEHVA